MIGTIRKHSKWLWWSIIPLTILSFVLYMGTGPAHTGNGGGDGGLGSIAGKKVTPQAFGAAKREVYLFYLFHYGAWPDSKEANISEANLEREIYIRMLLMQKAADLGIHIGDVAVVTAANEMLRSLGRDGQPAPMDAFIKQVLEPKGLSEADFERFVRHDLVVQQLIQALGLTGELVTPQEAAAVYQREYRELSAQVVFFSATNYLSSVKSTPTDITQFYTNYLAAYRLPDRVQVGYVEFSLSNHLASAEQKLSKTNFQEQIDAIYVKYGPKAFPEAKTPAEAKATIRDSMIREQALMDAREQANEFATAVFNLTPAKSENLAVVAKQKGLAVHGTAPFASKYGPQEFNAPGAFTKSAFELTAEEPFAGPIPGSTSLYVMALGKNLPSEIPSFDAIHDRVAQDYQRITAIQIAQREGTNFYFSAAVQMAAGKTFAQVAVAAGQSPVILPPFSLSTDALPELGERATLNQFKQAAFGTPIGKTSAFQPTSDGGFIVFVQSQLPVDQAKMNKDLPISWPLIAARARTNHSIRGSSAKRTSHCKTRRSIVNKPPLRLARPNKSAPPQSFSIAERIALMISP